MDSIAYYQEALTKAKKHVTELEAILEDLKHPRFDRTKNGNFFKGTQTGSIYMVINNGDLVIVLSGKYGPPTIGLVYTKESVKGYQLTPFSGTINTPSFKD